MQNKLWISFMSSLALVCVLAACGVPATGTGTSTQTVVAEATAITPTIVLPTPAQATQTATSGGAALGGVDGTSWQLIELGPADAMLPAAGDVTMVFGPDDKISGNSGCNSYGGTYTLNGTTFSVADVATTMMACMDDSLMQQESAFGAALNSATDLSINGDELRITYPEGALRFSRLAAATAAPIEGTVWELESFVVGTGDDALASSLVSGSSISAEWGDGTVRGTAGCNQFSASYTQEGETLTVGEVVATEMGCEGSIMQQEQAFVASLGAARSLKLDGTNLVLEHSDGQLVFRSQ